MLHGQHRRRVRSRRVSLHVVATLVSTLLIALVVAALSWTAYHGAQRSLASASGEAVEQAVALLDERIARLYEPAENQLGLLVHGPFGDAESLADRLDLVPVARAVFRGNPLVEAFYAGYPDGDFVLFRPLRDAETRVRFAAPEDADMLVQSVSSERDPVGEYRFFHASGRLLELRAQDDYQFDPRDRPWYEAARADEATVLTEPYRFFTTRAVGVTMARRTAGEAVVGLDVNFHDLAAKMASLRMTSSSHIAVVDGEDTVMAHHETQRMLRSEDDEGVRLATIAELDVAPLLAASALTHDSIVRRSAGLGEDTWQIMRKPLSPIGDLTPYALIAIPEAEMFVGARRIVRNQVLLALVIMVLSVPLAWWLSHRTVGSLRRLAEQTRAIQAFDFSPRRPVRSFIAEIETLSGATERMRNTIANFLDTNVALGAETETATLLDTILANVIDAAQAHGGAIYRSDEPGRLVCARKQEVDIAGVEFFVSVDLDGDALVAIAAREMRTCVAPLDAQAVQVATPLRTRTGEIVGAIVVVLPGREVLQHSERDPRLGFIEALSSSAAVAIETRELIDQQKHLLESFIQLIAAAIDAKSPYTGGHCQRVPELTKMLAEVAHNDERGIFARFRLSDADREALHIAAWLHDCGKITTPEHVVDKATKLECMYNRIHEVRMRFEVLKRDAHVAALEARLEGVDAGRAREAMVQTWRTLDEEFAFVARCNAGDEPMDAADIERLSHIARRSWSRTLDDRLGLSRDELKRRDRAPGEQPPVREPLLMDAVWHRVTRAPDERLQPDNPWGFNMHTPACKQDLGELHNLGIRKGTLTEEDRYIINHHIVQTIVMLSKLPFPPHLRQVPEIAGGHHERMDGKGYPRGLRGNQMSVMARIMAVADVFEALTAADRPYKRARSLSKALELMADMVRDGHLDPELFALFLDTRLHEQYARRHMDPAQIDAVDLEALYSRAGLYKM